MDNVHVLHPHRAEQQATQPAKPRVMSVDDFVERIEVLRQRKDLDVGVRRGIENVLNAVVDYVEKVYLAHEAACSPYPSESVPIRPPSGSKKEGHSPRGRDGKLDRFLKREVRSDLNSLARTTDARSQRILSALNGETPRRRAKLTDAQVADIKRRLPTESKQALADEFSVSHGTIRSIESGRTWRESPGRGE